MIFCYEEDHALAAIIKESLKQAEYEIVLFSKGKDLADELTRCRPELIIVDTMSENENGGGVLSYLREICKSRGIPLLLICASWMECNILSGVELRDEHCLLKPFNATALKSAVSAALAKECIYEQRDLICGDIALNTAEKLVTVKQKQVILTNKEYSLLRFLMDNCAVPFTRQQIYNCVWGEEYMGQSRTVDVHIGSLRRKLGDSGKYIKAITGKGYMISEI